MPLLPRLGALLLLMLIVALIDWRWHGADATRWREYGFLLAAGMFGGLVGVAIDQLTATISPGYFVIGKGVSAGAGFRWGVAAVGFQAGLAVGMVIGGVYLLANNPRVGQRSLPFKRLFRNAAAPLVAAFGLVPLAVLIVRCCDPSNLSHELHGLLQPAEITRVLTVWGIHLGLYAGGVLGTVYGVLRIRRSRALLAADEQIAN